MNDSVCDATTQILPFRKWLRQAALSLLIGFAALPGSGAAAALNFEGYQEPDGAITVQHGGDLVDPYFAIRALLMARGAGLNVEEAAAAWIRWLLPRQQNDGRFARYCRLPGGWEACQPADADDALLAIWLELLYDMTTGSTMQPDWQASATAAATYLAGLRHPAHGIYLISHALPVGLFMDNVEIYAAWRAIGLDRRRMGDRRGSLDATRQAARLRMGIEEVFHANPRAPYLVSTQTGAGGSFYPDVVAQIYPVLFDMPMPGRTAKAAMQEWLRAHEKEWLSMMQDHYPWGMVAMAANKAGRCDVGARWVELAAPFRHGSRWNVIEEVAFVALSERAGKKAEQQCKRGKGMP